MQTAYGRRATFAQKVRLRMGFRTFFVVKLVQLVRAPYIDEHQPTHAVQAFQPDRPAPISKRPKGSLSGMS